MNQRKTARSETSPPRKLYSVRPESPPNQTELELHTRSNHPTNPPDQQDSTAILASFPIPVERFKPKRLPCVIEQSFAVTARIPSTGGDPVRRKGRGFQPKNVSASCGKPVNDVHIKNEKWHQGLDGEHQALLSYNHPSMDGPGKSSINYDSRTPSTISNLLVAGPVSRKGRGFQPKNMPASCGKPGKNVHIKNENPLDGEHQALLSYNHPSMVGPGKSGINCDSHSPSTVSNLKVVGPTTHHETSAKTQRLFCPSCTQEFIGQTALDGHLINCPLIRSNQPMNRAAPFLRVFQCHRCDSSFPSKAALRFHSKVGHGNPTLVLPPITPTNVTPTRTPLIRCEPCRRGFPTPKALDLHLLNSSMHTPKHHCNLCSSNFPTQGALQVHQILVHALDFPCDQCDACFAPEELRVLHGRSVHDAAAGGVDWFEARLQNRVHRCENCGSEFLRMEELKMHSQNCRNVQEAAPERKEVRDSTWTCLVQNSVHRSA